MMMCSRRRYALHLLLIPLSLICSEYNGECNAQVSVPNIQLLERLKQLFEIFTKTIIVVSNHHYMIIDAMQCSLFFFFTCRSASTSLGVLVSNYQIYLGFIFMVAPKKTMGLSLENRESRHSWGYRLPETHDQTTGFFLSDIWVELILWCCHFLWRLSVTFLTESFAGCPALAGGGTFSSAPN